MEERELKRHQPAALFYQRALLVSKLIRMISLHHEQEREIEKKKDETGMGR